MHGGITFFPDQDRRAARRLQLELDLRFRAYGTGAIQSGITKDISSLGISFYGQSGRLAIGTLLDIHIVIPPLHGVLEHGGVLRCSGEVVRVQADPLGRVLIACRFCSRPRLKGMIVYNSHMPSNTSTQGPVI